MMKMLVFVILNSSVSASMLSMFFTIRDCGMVKACVAAIVIVMVIVCTNDILNVLVVTH